MLTQWFEKLLDPGMDGLHVYDVRPMGGMLTLICVATSLEAYCPVCHQQSRRIHSRYVRKLLDVPLRKVQVQIQLHTRKFFCDQPDCTRKIFSEQFPQLAKAHSRRTETLNEWLSKLVFAANANCAMRLAKHFDISISANTLLRLLRRSSLMPQVTTEILGLDDWAYRKGQRYGAILVDLEQHSVVDLLPDRSATVISTWLKRYPTIKIVSRDRGDSMVRGVNEGASQALPVADRWHLYHNLGEMVRRVAERHYGDLRQLIRMQNSDRPVFATNDALNVATPKAILELKQRNQYYRDRYDHVHQLHQSGASISQISREMHLDRKTVAKLLRLDTYPGIPQRGQPNVSPLIAFKDYLQQRWSEGQRNISELWREIQARGYNGYYASVRNLVQQMIATEVITAPIAIQPSPKPNLLTLPSIFQTTKWLSGNTSSLAAQQQAVLEQWRHRVPALQMTQTLAQQFIALLRQRDTNRPQELAAWLNTAQASGVAAVQSFAKGILEDRLAVENALTLPWSSGQVEGQVNRLKLIKRMMYGRAKFDLLRIRVLNKV